MFVHCRSVVDSFSGCVGGLNPIEAIDNLTDTLYPTSSAKLGKLTSRESHWFSLSLLHAVTQTVTHRSRITKGRFSRALIPVVEPHSSNADAGLNKNDPENRVTHNGRPAPSRAL